MRNINLHKVGGEAIEVVAVDERGSGGANHHYNIDGPSREIGGEKAPAFRVDIRFQKGAILESGVNGVTSEALLAVLLDRHQGFQSGQFPSRENAIVITKLQEALMWLQQRTRDRIARGVEGETKA